MRHTKKILYIILFLLVAVCFCLDSTFASMPVNPSYVSYNGSGSACTIGSPCALSYANANADDDDIVYLRDSGDYGNQSIDPDNSGSSGHQIIFRKYTGETPTFTRTGSTPSIHLDGVTYIQVDGIEIVNGTGNQILLENTANYNEITGCTTSGNDNGPAIFISYSHYNYLHDNDFNQQATPTYEDDERDTINLIGADYNRIISNTFREGGGHFFIQCGYKPFYNIVRGNTILTTEAAGLDEYYEGTDGFIASNCQYTLVEENTWTNTATSTNAAQVFYQLMGSNNILRKNTINAIKGWNQLSAITNQNSDVNNNTIYNNTFYHTNTGTRETGYGVFNFYNPTDTQFDVANNEIVNNIVDTAPNYGFRSGFTSGTVDNIFSNRLRGNILYSIGGTEVRRFSSSMTLATAETSYSSEFLNNLLPTSTQPTYTNAGSGDFSADDGDAPQVDAGAWLTTVNGNSSDTTFDVLDAHYFYDGWGISGETGDTIKTENGQTCTISSIDYGNKRITCTASIYVVNGEGVALNYQGNKPDIGAKEYGDAPPPLDNGIENPSPGNGAEDVALSVDPTWTNGEDVVTTQFYADKVDCSTSLYNDTAVETYDLTTTYNETWYWKVKSTDSGANVQTDPATGCYSYATITTPTQPSGGGYQAGAPPSVYQAGAAEDVYLAP